MLVFGKSPFKKGRHINDDSLSCWNIVIDSDDQNDFVYF